MALGVLALGLVGCTGTATAPTAPPTAAAAPKPTAAAPAPAVAASPAASPVAAATPSGPATVKVVQSPLGAILADAAGRTLYMFTTDKDKTSACYDNCERAWPPLLTRGPAQAGEGAQAARLSTTTRRDNNVQVVYGDFPLYYYTPDTAPGDTKGQKVGGVWFVLGPDGVPIKS